MVEIDYNTPNNVGNPPRKRCALPKPELYVIKSPPFPHNFVMAGVCQKHAIGVDFPTYNRVMRKVHQRGRNMGFDPSLIKISVKSSSLAHCVQEAIKASETP